MTTAGSTIVSLDAEPDPLRAWGLQAKRRVGPAGRRVQ